MTGTWDGNWSLPVLRVPALFLTQIIFGMSQGVSANSINICGDGRNGLGAWKADG